MYYKYNIYIHHIDRPYIGKIGGGGGKANVEGQ